MLSWGSLISGSRTACHSRYQTLASEQRMLCPAGRAESLQAEPRPASEPSRRGARPHRPPGRSGSSPQPPPDQGPADGPSRLGSMQTAGPLPTWPSGPRTITNSLASSPRREPNIFISKNSKTLSTILPTEAQSQIPLRLQRALPPPNLLNAKQPSESSWMWAEGTVTGQEVSSASLPPATWLSPGASVPLPARQGLGRGCRVSPPLDHDRLVFPAAKVLHPFFSTLSSFPTFLQLELCARERRRAMCPARDETTSPHW